MRPDCHKQKKTDSTWASLTLLYPVQKVHGEVPPLRRGHNFTLGFHLWLIHVNHKDGDHATHSNPRIHSRIYNNMCNMHACYLQIEKTKWCICTHKIWIYILIVLFFEWWKHLVSMVLTFCDWQPCEAETVTSPDACPLGVLLYGGFLVCPLYIYIHDNTHKQ